ncbi:MAG: ester cyclase [Chloroflexota bacterium]|nr:ester cyclase [Chloroflexota bacterium]
MNRNAIRTLVTGIAIVTSALFAVGSHAQTDIAASCSAERDANLAVVLGLYDTVLNAHDTGTAAAYIASDFVWHTQQAQGLEGFIGFYMGIFGSFPDVARTPSLCIVEDDVVVVYSTIIGTHEGDLLGVPASGNPIAYTSMDVFRVADGIIVEQWDQGDYLTLFTQIGVIPPLGGGQ